MAKTTKAIAGAAVALMLTGGVAAAATGGGSSGPPSEAGPGLSTAQDHTGFAVPASNDSHPTASDHPGADASSNSQPDNHGAAVSEVARTTTAVGADKGAAVSAAAQDNTGLTDHAQPDEAATPGTVPDGLPDEASDGAAHAAGHGRP